MSFSRFPQIFVVALAFVTGVLWVSPNSARAACILGGGLAGRNAAYLYAVAHVNGLINADEAFRISKKAGQLSEPALNKPQALASFTEQLTTLELTAKGFECAALAVRPQKKFPLDKSNELAQKKSELAREVAGFAEAIYLELAKETRTVSSLLVQRGKQTIDDIDLSAKLAQSFAKTKELSSDLVQFSPMVAHVLVDPNPDAAGHLSRLAITAAERADLIGSIDAFFGERAQRKTQTDFDAIEASVILIREWLTKPGYTPRK